MHRSISSLSNSGYLTYIFCLVSLLPSYGLGQEISGEKLFMENCAECHQPSGQGIPNVYPALAGNRLVKGSAVDVALVLLVGRGEMPSFAVMIPNSEIAAIINYVRNAWGNEGTLITEETIAKLQ